MPASAAPEAPEPAWLRPPETTLFSILRLQSQRRFSTPQPGRTRNPDYKRELKKTTSGIDFHRLYTTTNMPIARVASTKPEAPGGKLENHATQLLVESFNLRLPVAAYL